MTPMDFASAISGGASLMLAALAIVAQLGGTTFPLAVYLGLAIFGACAAVLVVYSLSARGSD